MVAFGGGGRRRHPTLDAFAGCRYDYFQMSGCAPLAHYFPAGDPVQNSQQTTDCVATFAIDTPAMTGQIVEACDVTCSPATTAASCSFSRNDVLPTYIVEQVGPNAFEAWTSSPICIKTGTCSDGEQSAGEEGVDCGGTCSLACTFIDESFCGIQYNQDGTLASTITVTGSGFSVTRGQSVSAVVFNSFSITTQAAIVTVVSDTELELAFTTFPFSLVGVIGLTYTVTEQTTISFGSFSFTITTVVKTATVDHIATVFANAPTLDSRNSFINSSAQDFTLFGTGFDPAHCSDHDVVLVADCGTVAATASSTCTSNSLLVTISEMSSVSAGKLTARVRSITAIPMRVRDMSRCLLLTVISNDHCRWGLLVVRLLNLQWLQILQRWHQKFLTPLLLTETPILIKVSFCPWTKTLCAYDWGVWRALTLCGHFALCEQKLI